MTLKFKITPLSLLLQLALAIILLIFPSTTFAQPATLNKIFCDANNRPRPSDCTGFGNKPICSYYIDNCPTEICGRLKYDACTACSDPTTIYYTEGYCGPDEKLSTCEQAYCDYDRSPEDFEHYEPVCAIKESCIGTDCKKTFGNRCQACWNTGYKWYTEGVCKEERKTCSDKSLQKKCTAKQAVCAFFTDEYNILFHATANSAKEACKDQDMIYYVDGKCKMLEEDTKSYCLPNNRPGTCDAEYNPVCGVLKQPRNGRLYAVMSNACSACQDPDVIYHEPGPCFFKCDRSDGISGGCVGYFAEPVCGYYSHGGRDYKVSIKNSCVACYDYKPFIEKYTEGLCPGDQGINCEDEPENANNGAIFPVCGKLTEGCDHSSCRKTFAEPVAACHGSNSVLYTPGMCPGDQGISCDPYRPGRAGSLCGEDTEILYSNVCGYSRENCNDGSCRVTYSNQCNACQNRSILFFKEGPCPTNV